jgi:hypothetical protein
MSASLNSLRKFLRDAGCIEERSFGVVGRESLFIELRVSNEGRQFLSGDACD